MSEVGLSTVRPGDEICINYGVLFFLVFLGCLWCFTQITRVNEQGRVSLERINRERINSLTLIIIRNDLKVVFLAMSLLLR